MQDWVDRFAAAIGAPSLSADEIEQLLNLARDVAHSTGDRRLAPLTAFLVGTTSASGTRIDALKQACDAIGAVLPSEPPATPES